MAEIVKVISNWWPETKYEVSDYVRPYYDYRDELSVENGIVLKAESILVPKNLRNEFKERLYAAHLGYDSTMTRLKGTHFWSGMGNNIKEMCEVCKPCQELKAKKKWT